MATSISPSCRKQGAGLLKPAWLLFLAFLPVGCAHSPVGEYDSVLSAAFSQVQPPAFLAGPMAVLLTDAHGFSGHVVLHAGIASNGGAMVSGELLVRSNKLLFVQAGSSALKKRLCAGGISFIWDAADNHGYVLSEALQGYAPISFNVRPTNLIMSAASTAPQRVGGHPCGQEVATVSSSDGAVTLFHVWRAPDLNGLPVQITTATNTTPLALSLSNFRLEAPSAAEFQPPDGFARYDTAEAMMSELTMRQQNLKRRVTGGSTEPEPITSPESRRP